MTESTRTRPRAPRTQPAGTGIFGGSGDDRVTVTHGVYAEEISAAGMTVAQVRATFSDRFDLDPESQALVHGRPVGDDHRLTAGQVLTFAKKSGQKG
jgi:hypothetical protein